MRRITVVLLATLFTLLAIVMFSSCGRSSVKRLHVQTAQTPLDSTNMFVSPQPEVAWPAGLPVDAAQPWEKVNGAGRVVSSINLQSQFVPGVERFLEAGAVSDLGEASRMASGIPGSEGVSWSIYRVPMGAEQPGTIAADVNLRLTSASTESQYYIGVGDYSANTWHWHGPFSVSHVRFNVPSAAYTSALGNLMLAVVAYDGADFDLVGLGVNVRDNADTTPPPAPSAPVLTPVAGGVLAEWIPVVEADLAGYRVYANGKEAFGFIEGGTSTFIPASSDVAVTLSAVDVSGNESAQSGAANATPLTGTAPVVSLTAGAASGQRGDIIALNASGADSYDWDVNGDGNWDITGDTTGTAFANTTNMGIIRPALRAHAAGDGFWMGAVSLIIGGNSRPVASVTVDVASGIAPLSVNFSPYGEDDDGTIAEYMWDFDGDGIYDGFQPANPSPLPHTYLAPGLYNAKFRVTDNEGSWDVDTVAVQVLPAPGPGNVPPAADIQADVTSGNAPLTVSFNAGGSSDSDGNIVRYWWDFDGNGSYDQMTASASCSHIYGTAGIFSAKVMVEDNEGGTATDSVSITVNALPVAVLEATPPEGEKGLTVYLDASQSSDPDGSITDYEWDLDNDGAFNEAGVEADARGDSAVQVVYPNAGRYPIAVRASDDATPTGTNTASVTVVIHGWVIITVDSAGNVGQDTSLAVINGCPAISYTDTINSDLKYARATTSSGGSASDWTQIVTVDSAGVVGSWTSLALVDGCPAISYKDVFNQDLKYARAVTGTGGSASDWTQVMTVDNSIANVGDCTSLAVVNGCPAISYTDYDNGDLRYARAITSTGGNAADWTQKVNVDSAGNVGTFTSLEVVDGCPAISYSDGSNSHLKYARATTNTGGSALDWTQIVTVDSSGSSGGYTSLAVVDGCPAISYYDFINGLKYARAVTSTGGSASDWTQNVALTSPGSMSVSTSLSVIGGRPAISYFDWDNGDLRFAQATSSTGGSASDWTQDIAVDSDGFVGAATSVAEVDGCPAISYYDSTNTDLKYAILY
jgi:PKD repeat protein